VATSFYAHFNGVEFHAFPDYPARVAFSDANGVVIRFDKN